jgi:hypothetical protein
MTADNHLEKGPEFLKRYSAGIIFNLERKLKLFGITDFLGALISMDQGIPTCPPPVFPSMGFEAPSEAWSSLSPRLHEAASCRVRLFGRLSMLSSIG